MFKNKEMVAFSGISYWTLKTFEVLCDLIGNVSSNLVQFSGQKRKNVGYKSGPLYVKGIAKGVLDNLA